MLTISFTSLQDIDISLALLSITADRSRVVDFTSPLFDAHAAAMITTKQKDTFFVIEPVHYSVWLLCCCMVFVTSVYLHWFEIFPSPSRLNSSKNFSPDFYATLWMNLRILLNQGKCHLSRCSVNCGLNSKVKYIACNIYCDWNHISQ